MYCHKLHSGINKFLEVREMSEENIEIAISGWRVVLRKRMCFPATPCFCILHMEFLRVEKWRAGVYEGLLNN
jgi:hypothetical protein